MGRRERLDATKPAGSLDVSAHEHFTRPETDRTFFAHSTFQPAPARPRRPAPARAH